MVEVWSESFADGNLLPVVQDIEDISRENRFWKYVTPILEIRSRETLERCKVADTVNSSAGMSRSEAQRCNLVLAYIMTSVRKSSKEVVRKAK